MEHLRGQHDGLGTEATDPTESSIWRHALRLKLGISNVVPSHRFIGP